MLDIEKNQNRHYAFYMEVYEYYRKLILDGKMAPGSKMPSLQMLPGAEAFPDYY